ncbi:GntR family transcriptional regulator [Palleronia aestuarii]|uniref:GntR family transcriptional regulator n=1 Tax=Palleronia aestuarii TaxID=568105 RepID=A0A2W7MXV3_9RHOB|nr:FCD domain-containing protein [Palleronia aestuarii]PZX12373.1 GntR family transcriptional regulator [Palleronia aestuarii]
MPTGRRYQEVAEAIRDLIRTEGLADGARMMPERALSDRLNVPRSLVREALILLEIEGVVEVRKGSGIYIRTSSPMPSTELRDDVGPFELLQARQLLEADIAEFAASKVTDADIQRMREALRMERADLESGSGNYQGDRQFHRLIAAATQNSVLIDVVEDLWRRRERSPMWAKLHSRIFETTYRQAWLADHQTILSALQNRDRGGARQAMWMHLGNVRSTLMTLSDVDDPAFDGHQFEPVTLKA